MARRGLRAGIVVVGSPATGPVVGSPAAVVVVVEVRIRAWCYVKSLGPPNPSALGLLGPPSISPIPVGCLRLFEDVDQLLALRGISIMRPRALDSPEHMRTSLTVLITFPELLMIVTNSVAGILRALMLCRVGGLCFDSGFVVGLSSHELQVSHALVSTRLVLGCWIAGVCDNPQDFVFGIVSERIEKCKRRGD